MTDELKAASIDKNKKPADQISANNQAEVQNAQEIKKQNLEVVKTRFIKQKLDIKMNSEERKYEWKAVYTWLLLVNAVYIVLFYIIMKML